MAHSAFGQPPALGANIWLPESMVLTLGSPMGTKKRWNDSLLSPSASPTADRKTGNHGRSRTASSDSSPGSDSQGDHTFPSDNRQRVRAVHGNHPQRESDQTDRVRKLVEVQEAENEIHHRLSGVRRTSQRSSRSEKTCETCGKRCGRLAATFRGTAVRTRRDSLPCSLDRRLDYSSQRFCGCIALWGPTCRNPASNIRS